MKPKETKVPEFIDRINNPQNYPVINNKDGSISTHRMAHDQDDEGNWIVYPTIVGLPTGELYEFTDQVLAKSLALKSGNYLTMKDKAEATKYATGGYKIGTPLAKMKPKSKANGL